MTEPTVLIVDDERSNRESLEKIFQKDGFRALSCEGGPAALDALRKQSVDVVVTDLMMPGMSGVDLIKALKTIAPEVEVVLVTAYGTVESAVDAMRSGAYDVVEKPLKRAHIVKTVRKALERRSLVVENRALRQQLHVLEHRSIVGHSPAWRRTLDIAMQAAPSSATVLVMGESGTGKELLARAIHEASARASGPFVAVNCAAIPETIIEAELFGHERGAFTGAMQRREGRFALAAGGTLFLDEIGEIPLAVQVKLLRAVQEGAFEPLGGRTQRADVRIVAATNKNLAVEVKAGRFREDLYYRLNVIAITCPPLRERRDDIPLLADHFLRIYCAKNDKAVGGFTKGAMEALCEHSWPGNVRQLENTVERAVVLTRGNQIGTDDLPREVTEEDRPSVDLVIAVGTPLAEIERRAIHETLRHTRGDKRLAAQLLGIATRTIYRKLAEEQGEELPSELPDDDLRDA